MLDKQGLAVLFKGKRSLDLEQALGILKEAKIPRLAVARMGQRHGNHQKQRHQRGNGSMAHHGLQGSAPLMSRLGLVFQRGFQSAFSTRCLKITVLSRSMSPVQMKEAPLKSAL